MADAVIEVEGLRKEFGPLVAVDDVSFRVDEGRSLAVVGESGSGKTTVARMIVGLERPTAGTIRALGRDRSTPARSTRERRQRGAEVQIVFQDPYSSLDPRQTVGGLDRRGAAPAPRRLRRRAARPRRSSCATWSGSTSGSRARCRGACPVASASASRSRAPWRRSPVC